MANPVLRIRIYHWYTIFLSKTEIEQFWLSLVIVDNDHEPLTTKYMAGYCQHWAVSGYCQYWAVSAQNHT